MFSKKFFKNKINLIKGLNTFYYIFSLLDTELPSQLISVNPRIFR